MTQLFISLSVIALISSPVQPFLVSPGRSSAILPATAAVPNNGFKQLKNSILKYRIDSDDLPGDSGNAFQFISSTNEISAPQSSSSTTSRKSALNSLSVTELKRLLNDRGIDFRDCFEKRDLIARLENSSSPSSNTSWKSDGSSNSSNNYHLSDGERSVVKTFKRVSPAVANIKTSAVVPQRNSLFGLNLGSGTEVPLGSGSGFLWDDNGHVVTNYHVISPPGTSRVERSKTVMVKLAGMVEALEAKIVGIDPEKDLAVLRIVQNGKNRRLPRPIDVGTSNDLQVGQSVMAIGNPFGLDDTLTTGVVSALGRDVNGIDGRPIHGCVQTDAAINPGNSGGPLLDSRGRLIGVNTMIYAPSGGNVGIGFAIPVDTVRRVVNQIIQYGRVVKPTIGINVLDDRIVKFIEEQLGRPLDGCLVAQIVPNGPASASELRATAQNSAGSLILGDLIVAVNGEPVRQAEDLISALEEKRDREIVELTVLKSCDPEKRERVKVTLTTRDKLQASIGKAAAWE
eukprot:CAMPEP_0197177680 /NCGR_PEP_ID=MMETSP1423-20130617/3195_1 /TAXON_ID=476441 /ORGANISM="Pseudo-nitzschia heimii, Strain UNC1101" /LENGTH=512 /DNA_ID=CAMNT_0042627269 /DNA_START=64 /DNA_END=1602 /DNA_ORIENTATION=+